MKKHHVLKLTEKQAALLTFALSAAPQMHRNFLMHDDWDVDVTAERKRETNKAQRDLRKAYLLFQEKLNNG